MNILKNVYEILHVVTPLCILIHGPMQPIRKLAVILYTGKEKSKGAPVIVVCAIQTCFVRAWKMGLPIN